jgi:hypothetical protein
MHFRFGNTPGEICLDDTEVRDLASNEPVLPRNDFDAGPTSFKSDWRFWPADAQNTVGAVAVSAGTRSPFRAASRRG